MMAPIEFQAPWGGVLRLASSIIVAILLLLAFGLFFAFGRTSTLLGAFLFGVPVLIVAIAALFTIHGYVLTEEAIIVKRLGWLTRLPLENMQSVAGDAEAMQGALRLFGNGGLFSFSGEFWSRKLGRFRALATDPQRAVVLRYPQRTIVITPHDPQQFIMRTRTLLRTAQFPR